MVISIGGRVGVSVAGNHSTVAVKEGDGVVVEVGNGVGVTTDTQALNPNAIQKKISFLIMEF